MEPTDGLVAATFLSRPNRFIVHAALDGGDDVRAHLGDPGRLRDLMLPGAALRLRPAVPGAGRSTAYTVALVRSGPPGASWVSVETGRANRLAGQLLETGRVRGIPRGKRIRREVRHGVNRFDFAVETHRGATVWVEVKSVTLVESAVARFPDAPTVRGTRHVRELAALARGGARAAVLFVVQRDDARAVASHPAIDPDFSHALRDALQAGVVLKAARFRLQADGRATYLGPLRVRAD